MSIIFRKLTIVCYERGSSQKNRNLLEKKIITDNAKKYEFVGGLKCGYKRKKVCKNTHS